LTLAQNLLNGQVVAGKVLSHVRIFTHQRLLHHKTPTW
jgi:hypothetical protein